MEDRSTTSGMDGWMDGNGGVEQKEAVDKDRRGVLSHYKDDYHSVE